MTQPLPNDNTAPVREGDILDGKYLVERVLGLGGMGVVVAAKHLQLDQRVAIKFVLPQAVRDGETMERFAREARAAVKLRSEHVARVLDVGTLANGAPYMVMEYLAGSDLGDMIESSGPLPYVDAVDYVLQACEAIAEAHSQGIVHRDLKPRNLFVTHGVTGKPLVKVLDFGISKQTSPLAGSQKELSLTRTSMVMGSPNYMSPEQLKSTKSVDARTDIWALGVILFEVLTTRVPFEAETVTQLTAMVLQDTPRPVDQLRTDVPAALARVISRCLEKDLTKRYASVADLARDLEPFGSQRGIAQRIAEVNGLRGAVPRPSGSAPAVAQGPTSVAWEDTQLAGTPKKRGMVAVVALVGVLAVVGVGALLGRVRSTSTTPLEITPTVRQIDLAASAPSIPRPAPPPPAASVPAGTVSTVLATPAVPVPLASASVSAPVASASSAPRASVGQKPPPRPTATKRPAKRSGDDFPDERN